MVFRNLDTKRLTQILTDTNGKIFQATFVKKNGEVRDIHCRTNVKKHVKGTGKPSFALKDDNPYQLVYDLQKKGYRVINCDTLQRIKFQNNIYER